MNEIEKASPKKLVDVILSGIATEEERGIALRNMQTYLGASLIDNLENARQSFQELEDLGAKLQAKWLEKVNEALTSDLLDKDALFEMMTALQKNKIQFMDLQRKIVQSPNKLFGDDLLSSEEKKVLMILKSFKTPAEKEKFIKAVEKAMKDDNNFDADDDLNK